VLQELDDVFEDLDVDDVFDDIGNGAAEATKKLGELAKDALDGMEGVVKGKKKTKKKNKHKGKKKASKGHELAPMHANVIHCFLFCAGAAKKSANPDGQALLASMLGQMTLCTSGMCACGNAKPGDKRPRPCPRLKK
jgi:hypothetical protein